MQLEAWPPAEVERRLRETEGSLAQLPSLCPGSSHSVHLPGGGRCVWLSGSSVHLQDLVRKWGSAQPLAAADILARSPRISHAVARLWWSMAWAADLDHSTRACMAWSFRVLICEWVRAGPASWMFEDGVRVCVQLLKWLAPRALSAFPLEDVLVSVSPSMVSFPGKVQGPSRWRGWVQVGEKAGRAQKQVGEG